MKILIAGDFCPSFRVSELINQAKFNDVLDEVKSTIEAQKIDYSIVNLEAPITLSKSCTILLQVLYPKTSFSIYLNAFL